MADDYIKGLLSTGETLLIDTKQHWMALLRYAIRPLLLAGLVVLLALLNQWLNFNTFHFINDIVNWILIIAIIVTVIWLPIDIVRWWSRRYLLTNRRAMRMQGVLRKSSYDCSLEQINDILLSQSFLGSKLGYADLTLLTANASNEAYEQLRDGSQFKKAVLDAKEAIRTGHPLQALPEGFVVKGGTNEASMRAEAKGGSTEQSGAVSASTMMAGSAVATGSAAPEAAPSPEPTATSAPVGAMEEAESSADARGAITGSTIDAAAGPQSDVASEGTDLVEDASSGIDDTVTAADGDPSLR